MYTIRNLMGKAVSLCTTSGVVLKSWEPDSFVAFAAPTFRPDRCVDIDGHIVEVVRSEYRPLVNLPAPTEGVFLLVTYSVAKAARCEGRTTEDLLTPNDVIKDEKNRIIGCTRFARL